MTSHGVTATGLELRDTLGPKDGLWVTGMEDIATLMVGGQQFIIGVSAHSGTLLVIRINPVGALFITDIALDVRTTRFDGAVVLATFEIHRLGHWQSPCKTSPPPSSGPRCRSWLRAPAGGWRRWCWT